MVLKIYQYLCCYEKSTMTSRCFPSEQVWEPLFICVCGWDFMLHTCSIVLFFSAKLFSIYMKLNILAFHNILKIILWIFKCFPSVQACRVWEILEDFSQLFLTLFVFKRVSVNCSFCSSPCCHFFTKYWLLYPVIICSLHIYPRRVVLLWVTHYWEGLAIF